MDATYPTDPRMLDLALLVARLVIGLLMAAHGAQNDMETQDGKQP